MRKLIFIIIAISNLTMVFASDLNLDSLQRIAYQKDSLLQMEYKVAKQKLLQTLIQQRLIYQVIIDASNGSYNLGAPSDVVLTDTGYKFKFATNTVAIEFDYLTNLKIKVYNANNSIQGNANSPVSQLKIGGVRLAVSIEQQYALVNISNQFRKVQQLHNEIFYNINQFEVWAAQYIHAPEKPLVTETQRKYIIQADAATKLYQYDKAISLNNSIINIHPTSYPNAYMNIALLQGETNRLHSAIHNMKKYIQLNTDSTDAKFAATKINEWEIILNN